MKINVVYENLIDVQEYINDYANSLEEKIELVIDKLLAKGLEVATVSARGEEHEFERRVEFSYTIYEGLTGELVGQGTPFSSYWVDGDGQEHNDTVYPMYMLEFGSAALAVSISEYSKYDYFGADANMIGKGSFSVRGNEDNKDWHFKRSPHGKAEHGTAVEPQRPMLKAYLQMKADIISVVKEVFKS